MPTKKERLYVLILHWCLDGHSGDSNEVDDACNSALNHLDEMKFSSSDVRDVVRCFLTERRRAHQDMQVASAKAAFEAKTRLFPCYGKRHIWGGGDVQPFKAEIRDSETIDLQDYLNKRSGGKVDILVPIVLFIRSPQSSSSRPVDPAYPILMFKGEVAYPPLQEPTHSFSSSSSSSKSVLDRLPFIVSPTMVGFTVPQLWESLPLSHSSLSDPIATRRPADLSSGPPPPPPPPPPPAAPPAPEGKGILQGPPPSDPLDLADDDDDFPAPDVPPPDVRPPDLLLPGLELPAIRLPPGPLSPVTQVWALSRILLAARERPKLVALAALMRLTLDEMIEFAPTLDLLSGVVR